MKRLKIAVCLSAQSRTWRGTLESHRRFFASEKNDYYFFGHTWNQNSWRENSSTIYVHEIMPKDKLQKDLQDSFGFTKLKVEKQFVWNRDTRTDQTWGPMLKSAMIANYLKQEYEFENDMKFDVVVKTRFDHAYYPETSMDTFIDAMRQDEPTAIYSHVSHFPLEYYFPCIDDTFYYGSSRQIDILDNFYRYYSNNSFYDLMKMDQFNPAWENVGCGVMLYKWATIKNMLIRPIDFKTPLVLRKRVENFKWPDEFDSVLKAYLQFHK